MNIAKIFSTLGNSESLVPLAIKDFSATGGMTAGSFVTGKEEGQDRFIDEMGTEIIWLFGIPAFKWLFDNTVFKLMKYDSNFDARNLKDKDVFEKIKKYSPDKKIEASVEKIAKNQKLFKNITTAKFFVSTAMTIGSYIGLTKFKQHYTENKIRKNLIAEYEANKAKKQEETIAGNNVSFKGLGNVIETFAFSPVKNMWILDGAITGERLKDSRSSQEFIGYGIKEAFTLCFMYYAGNKIQQALENYAKKKHNKTIGFDAKVLEEGHLKKSFEDGSIEKSLRDFKAIGANKADLYEFLHTNPDNMIVKTAKESGIIKSYKDTDKIDTRKYIDLEEVEAINKKIDELYSQYKKALANGETSDKFFAGVRKLKRNAILTGLGTCMFFLGVVTPGVMLLKRFTVGDDEEFQTKKIIRQQLIDEGIIK